MAHEYYELLYKVVTCQNKLVRQDSQNFEINSSVVLLTGKKLVSFFITPSTNASGHDAPLVIRIFTGFLFGKKSVVSNSSLYENYNAVFLLLKEFFLHC